jgi:hypothetical protein
VRPVISVEEVFELSFLAMDYPVTIGDATLTQAAFGTVAQPPQGCHSEGSCLDAMLTTNLTTIEQRPRASVGVQTTPS